MIRGSMLKVVGMVDGKKALVEVEVVKPDEVSDEVVEAFIKAIEGKEKFYTVEELEEFLKKKKD